MTDQPTTPTQSARTPNAELAYRVLDHIDRNPEQWDQQNWFRETKCGTAACFAGWAVVLTGGDVEVNASGDWKSVTLDGEEFRYFNIAGLNALGIETDEVPDSKHDCPCGCGGTEIDQLFDGANTRSDLGRIVAEIFGPRPGGAA
jgi:hypothetical protein